MADRGVNVVRSSRWMALALVLTAGAGCTPMDNLIVSVFGRSMRDQSSILPYQAPQLPPVGSVPFASGNFPAAQGEFGMGQAEGVAIPEPVSAIDLLRAGGEPGGFPAINGLINPVAADAGSLARGEELYNRACVPCHGDTGLGNGRVTAAGVPVRSIVSDETRAFTDGYLYTIIRIGRGAMPAYGHQVSHFDRWHLVNYVRQLQGLGGVALQGETPGLAPVTSAPAEDQDSDTEDAGDLSDA
jgi:mono/diheme cytochrome c family protein